MATEAAKAIEAILMVAQEPVDPHLLAQVLEVSPARVAELCEELQAGYEAQDRGFVLAKVAGGYRFQSHGDLAPYVERFVLEGQTARLSSAALETLAIVAYKQPISRAQVAAIRGVNVDGVMRTLQQRGYIAEVGRDPGPGQATLFGTTSEFLERLGLDRVEDLPPIADLFPSADVMEALERGLRAEPREQPAPTGAEGEGEGPDEGTRGSATEPLLPSAPEDAGDLVAPAPEDAGELEPAPEDAGEVVSAAPEDAAALEAASVETDATAAEAQAEATTGGAHGAHDVADPADDLEPPAWFTELEEAPPAAGVEPGADPTVDAEVGETPDPEGSAADRTGE